jgi:large subunit ribosomal protein L15
VVNLGRLQRALDAGRLDAQNTVDVAALVRAGLAKGRGAGVRLLARGELKARLTIAVSGASKAAVQAVEQAGGKVLLPAAAEPPAA